ncbi:MAG: type IV conjugative transfer system coupling protein TraD [Proteobacteria bacterium]|nr:type IV conjugative transfer system coupling protein TraD [Pseudomonadota bacterium]
MKKEDKNRQQRNTRKTKSFVRGGQLFLYNTRMFTQVAGRITKWAILLYLLIVVLLMSLMTEWNDMRLLSMEVYCYILNFFGLGYVHAWTNPLNPNQYFTAISHLNDPQSQNLVAEAFNRFIKNGIVSLVAGFVLYLGITRLFTRYFIKQGDKHTDDQLISGTVLAKNIKQTIKSVEQSPKGASDIRLANVLPLPRFSEYQGILCHGSIGSGKSQMIMRLLDDIRTSGDAAIIYDKECVLKPYFFDEARDVELNPMSTLCQNWDIWAECETPIEMAAIAMYMMPKSVQGSDPFWVDAARTIFSTTAWEMREHKDRSIIKLLQVILTTSLDEFRRILAKTEAENLVSKDIEKTAISIRAVMATYTKALRFLEGLDKDKHKKPFAIKNWIQQQHNSTEHQKGWLFISSRANIHAEIKPLISAWIGMAMKGVQNLPANSGRRFWIVMDEMASLNRLENFSDIAADIRKFGGCIAVGIQSISQLEFIYGRDEATAISDLLNTAVYSRSPKQRVADWVSKDLGEQIVEEVRESQSYGPNAIRDGNTISRQRATRRTVDTGTIMTMNDLEFYIRLVGDHPITHMNCDYVTGRKVLLDKPLEERVIDWDAIKKITLAAAEAENNPEVVSEVKAEQQHNKETDKVANDENATGDSNHKNQTNKSNDAHSTETIESSLVYHEHKF